MVLNRHRSCGINLPTGLVNLSAFKIRFGESLSLKYLAYFALYIGLAVALVLGS